MTKRRATTSLPDRIAKRPSPQQWGEDELLTLPEAAALLWPDGPLTTTSLRTAVRDGRLEVAEIAGKLFTTMSALQRMSVCRRRTPGFHDGKPEDVRPAKTVADMQHRYLARLRGDG